MLDAHIETGPAPECRLTPADLPALTDSYIVILATWAEPELRREAAIIAGHRGLELAARPGRHNQLMAEALSSHVHVRQEAA